MDNALSRAVHEFDSTEHQDDLPWDGSTHHERMDATSRMFASGVVSVDNIVAQDYGQSMCPLPKSTRGDDAGDGYGAQVVRPSVRKRQHVERRHEKIAFVPALNTQPTGHETACALHLVSGSGVGNDAQSSSVESSRRGSNLAGRHPSVSRPGKLQGAQSHVSLQQHERKRLCGKADPSTASEVKDMSQRLDELERKISMISSPSYNLEKRRRLEEWLSRNVYNWDLGRE
jgi:hypothetical protein